MKGQTKRVGGQSVLGMGALLGCWAPQGPRSPSRPWAAAGAGAGAPSREKAKALARPAGAAEDTGAAAALDGRSARRGQASRLGRRAGVAVQAQQEKTPCPQSAGRRIGGSSLRQPAADTSMACSCVITPGSAKTQGGARMKRSASQPQHPYLHETGRCSAQEKCPPMTGGGGHRYRVGSRHYGSERCSGQSHRAQGGGRDVQAVAPSRSQVGFPQFPGHIQ